MKGESKSRLLVLQVIRAIALLALFVPVACDHREFLYETPSGRVAVKVEFDWSVDPGAAPGGMTVYFYRAGSKAASPAAYDFKGRDGGTVSLVPGVYSAICHNNDSDRHGCVSQESYDDFGIRLNDHRYTGNINSNTMGTPRLEDERIAHSPDSMWVGAIPVFSIDVPDPLAESASECKVISFVMQPVVNHYTFIITNPVNFTNSLSVSATLSGMAGTVHPGRGTTGYETVTHLFELSPTAGGDLYGEILTFGHCSGGSLTSREDDEDERTHTLVVRATLADGRNWSSVHDVTEQIHGSKNPDCVIRLDSVAFPKLASSGGFSPTVSDWPGSQEKVEM